MKEDNLVHADTAPALSQNGQQTSVPKTMERIAYDAYRSKVPGSVQWYDILSRDGWRAAADAVVEECAKIADKREEQNQIVVDNNQDCPQTKGFFGAIARDAKIIASAIRSLKSSGRVVDRNAPGCDGRSLEPKSFLAKEDADGNG